MIGEFRLVLNEATLIAAIQEYVDRHFVGEIEVRDCKFGESYDEVELTLAQPARAEEKSDAD